MGHAECVSLAGTNPFRTWTSRSFESVWWNECAHALDLRLYSHMKELVWSGFRTNMNSKDKSPQPDSSEKGWTPDASSLRIASPTLHPLNNTYNPFHSQTVSLANQSARSNVMWQFDWSKCQEQCHVKVWLIEVPGAVSCESLADRSARSNVTWQFGWSKCQEQCHVTVWLIKVPGAMSCDSLADQSARSNALILGRVSSEVALAIHLVSHKVW